MMTLPVHPGLTLARKRKSHLAWPASSNRKIGIWLQNVLFLAAQMLFQGIRRQRHIHIAKNNIAAGREARPGGERRVIPRVSLRMIAHTRIGRGFGADAIGINHRAVIDEDQFEISVGLRQHRIDGRQNQIAIVEKRHHQADFGVGETLLGHALRKSRGAGIFGL